MSDDQIAVAAGMPFQQGENRLNVGYQQQAAAVNGVTHRDSLAPIEPAGLARWSRLAAMEPPTFRPGDPQWRAGWDSRGLQVGALVQHLIASGYDTEPGGLQVLQARMLAMRPTPPTVPKGDGE